MQLKRVALGLEERERRLGLTATHDERRPETGTPALPGPRSLGQLLARLVVHDDHDVGALLGEDDTASELNELVVGDALGELHPGLHSGGHG